LYLFVVFICCIYLLYLFVVFICCIYLLYSPNTNEQVTSIEHVKVD